MNVPLLRVVPLEPEYLPQLFMYLDDQLQENGRDGTPLFQPLSRMQAWMPP